MPAHDLCDLLNYILQHEKLCLLKPNGIATNFASMAPAALPTQFNSFGAILTPAAMLLSAKRNVQH